jgi:hypothetical protein
MEDRTGTPMCEPCATDALKSGRGHLHRHQPPGGGMIHPPPTCFTCKTSRFCIVHTPLATPHLDKPSKLANLDAHDAIQEIARGCSTYCLAGAAPLMAAFAAAHNKLDRATRLARQSRCHHCYRHPGPEALEQMRYAYVPTCIHCRWNSQQEEK